MAPPDQSDAMDVVLMADPLVAGTPVADTGEGLVDLRTRGFCVPSRLADTAGAFAHVRSGWLAGWMQRRMLCRQDCGC
jgi:hypothetical protein